MTSPLYPLWFHMYERLLRFTIWIQNYQLEILYIKSLVDTTTGLSWNKWYYSHVMWTVTQQVTDSWLWQSHRQSTYPRMWDHGWLHFHENFSILGVDYCSDWPDGRLEIIRLCVNLQTTALGISKCVPQGSGLGPLSFSQ